MTIFTIIRHGETDWNLTGEQQGQLDRGTWRLLSWGETGHLSATDSLDDG